MTRKHFELEREFIGDLEGRTGRTLPEWMAAIDAAGVVGKNEIIDWLRPQGFTFAHASWLERIHNNSGRPIYSEPPMGTVAVAAAPGSQVAPVAPPDFVMRTLASPVVARPAARPSSAAPAAPVDRGAESLADVLARGKAFRPLAELVLRQIESAVPGIVQHPAGELIRLGNPAEFAVLYVSPKEVRLGLNLGDAPFEDMLVKARVPGAGPITSHMVVLTDARQVSVALLERVQRANELANPPR